MTQEEKQLLLKDLCARLPYGVKGIRTYRPEKTVTLGEIIPRCKMNPNVGDGSFCELGFDDTFDLCAITEFKPYLRPMSSMTEEELEECRATCKYRQAGQSVLDCATPQTIDYLISHHFDYRGLIPMGLALEAKEGMYNTSPKWTPLRSGLKENEDGQIVGGLKL